MRRVAIDPVQIADPAPPVRLCDHPGCEAGGEFRAPRSRIELNSYYWFCLDHVRAYNAAWNYYAGMSEREIEDEIRRDTVWQRPSWKLGQRHGPAYEARMRDPFDLYSGKDRKSGNGNGHGRTQGADASARVASAREQALAVFDMDPPFTQTTLKARYKVLVKMHHPDAHGGDKEAEEKLKIINQAYTTLKASYFA
jgi:DnaJ domain